MSEEQKQRDLSEEVINKVIEWAEGLESMAAEHVPALAHEIVAYGFWMGVAKVIWGIIGGLSVWWFREYLAQRIVKTDLLDATERGPALACSYVVTVVLTIPAVIAMVNGGRAVIMTTVAPRLYAVERLMEMVK